MTSLEDIITCLCKTAFVIVFFLVMFNFIALLLGMMQANEKDSACNKRRNVEYVAPAYRVGCWLLQERK